MEDGTITLVGATTENPSFELNAALLSRARVLTFQPLDERRSSICSHGPKPIEGQAAAARCRRRATRWSAWPTATAAPR